MTIPNNSPSQHNNKINRATCHKYQMISIHCNHYQLTTHYTDDRTHFHKVIIPLPSTCSNISYYYLEPRSNTIEIITEKYADGSVYEGQKQGGYRHGKGKFYYSDGGLYDGEWKAGSMDGFGTLYYGGGQIAYQGEWKDDKFHGKGTVYNEIPESFEEEFDYTNFDGLADYWVKYEGQFLDDNKEGYGVMYLSNGDRFEGNFKDDMVHGQGVYICANGQRFGGEWWDNKLV